MHFAVIKQVATSVSMVTVSLFYCIVTWNCVMVCFLLTNVYTAQYGLLHSSDKGYIISSEYIMQ